MARQNLVSAVVDDAIVNAVLQHLTDSKEALPFLVTLSKEDRKKFRKMGPKSVEYVTNCYLGAQQFNNSLPQDFPMVEFSKDAKLLQQLLPMLVASQALTEGINDTILALGSDCMKEADEVYKYLKIAAASSANAKTLVDQIGRRFEGQGGGPSTTPKS